MKNREQLEIEVMGRIFDLIIAESKNGIFPAVIVFARPNGSVEKPLKVACAFEHPLIKAAVLCAIQDWASEKIQ